MIHPHAKPPKSVPALRKPIKRTRLKKRAKKTRVMEDGREILSPAAWSKRREEVRFLANSCCCRCNHFCAHGEVHHKIKRGMGSGFRDDRIGNLEWLCLICHRAEEAKGLRTKMIGGV
jgi:hypothetical protein